MNGRGRSASAALLVLGLLVGGCSAPGGSGGPSPNQPDTPTAPVSPAPAVSGSPAASPSAATSAEPGAVMDVHDAAVWLLDQTSARFEMTVTRYRPDETLRATVAHGVVDPAHDRGSMRYDLFPDDPPEIRISMDVTWDATDWWGSNAIDPLDEWVHVARDDAHERANIIGRSQEEPLALVRFAAAADPAAISPLPEADLDGRAADRWLVSVPAADLRAAFVPADTYLGFSEIFDRDDLPLEVWLVDGRIVRLGYVLERAETPRGGPDRHETWYDWTVDGDPIQLVIPPAGEIREMGE